MSRLSIATPGRAQTVVESLYRDVEHRISASPPGLCRRAVANRVRRGYRDGRTAHPNSRWQSFAARISDR